MIFPTILHFLLAQKTSLKMSNMLALLLGLWLVGAQGQDDSPDYSWCQEEEKCDEPPSKWKGLCQTGRQQSPINIITSTATLRPGPPAKVTFSKELCDDIVEWDICNYAVSLDLTFPGDLVKPKPWNYAIGGPVYNGDYFFNMLDFHWSENSTVGASHEIDGKKFALEVHIHTGYRKHFSHTKPNATETTAKGLKPSLFMTILFEIGPDDNPFLEPVIKVLPQLVNASKTPTRIKDKLNVFKLLPEKKDVYRYEGSSDVPFGDNPCSETVLWNIFAQPGKVSEKQMGEFRKLKAQKGRPFLRSARPVLQVKDHKIEKILMDITCKKHFSCKDKE